MKDILAFEHINTKGLGRSADVATQWPKERTSNVT